MRDLSPILLAQRWLMFIATLQGLLMLALYRAHLNDLWFMNEPVLFVPAWTLVLVLPVLLLLTLTTDRMRETLLYCCGFTGILTLTGVYIGMQLQPEIQSSDDSVRSAAVNSVSIVSAFGLCMTIAVFKGVMYVQQRTMGQPLTYPLLFSLSWRNFLVMALALLFVTITGLLLLLWSALFDAIGVSFFKYLFSRDWFLFPLLGFAFGVGIAIFREMSDVIGSITSLLQGMIRFLLPLLVLMSVIFLVSLLFVGPQTLWDTGFGTALILWLMAILLFFVNAVYQDGRGDPAYSPGVHRLVYVGMLCLPALAVMSFYGLWLRFEQYGLSTQRIYGWVVWLLLSLFSLGYAIAIVSKRDQWTLGLAQVNTVMGLVVLAVVVLLNTPVADPRVMTVASQLGRLDSGVLKIEEMDFAYFRRELARPGAEAVDRLKEKYGDEFPDLDWSGRNYPNLVAMANQTDEFWDNIPRYPADLMLPDGVLAETRRLSTALQLFDPVIVSIDLNGDDESEYLLFNLQTHRLISAWYFVRSGDVWQTGTLQPNRYATASANLMPIVLNGGVQLEQKVFSDVRLGDVVFIPMPTDRLVNKIPVATPIFLPESIDAKSP